MRFLDKYREELEKTDFASIKRVIEGIDVHEFPSEISMAKNAKMTIAVGEDIDPGDVVKWSISRGFRHFVNKNRDDYFSALLSSCLMIKSPDIFTKNALPLFIKDFDYKKENKDVRQKEIRFFSTRSRQKDLNQIADFLSEHPKTKNKIQQAHLIADEMMTNAIFNAPVDFNGRHLYAERNRTEEVVLPAHEGANLFIAHDDRKLVISCRDPFGSLDQEYLMGRLSDLFCKDTQAGPRPGSGGAGLGCKMMIENSGDFFVIRAKDRYTLVACSVPLGIGRRAMAEYPKNLHLVFN